MSSPRLSTALSQLSAYPDVPQPPPEVFGRMVRDADRQVLVFAEERNAEAAEMYADVIDIRRQMRLVVLCDGENPAHAAVQEEGDTPALIVDSAINLGLKDRFFDNSSMQDVVYFADHQYTPRSDHASPELHTVGITVRGMEALHAVTVTDALVHSCMQERRQRMRSVAGMDFSYHDFRALLSLQSVERAPFHALGPAGTNIERASADYLQVVGLNGKGQHIVHPTGIEPRSYAAMAAEQRAPGVVPMHMECAVYYGMKDLDAERPQELVFADHQYMPLIAMQLASQAASMEELAQRGRIRIASHPSPLPLIHSLLRNGDAVEYVKASSNSAAAQMVESGQADACITTEAARQASRLHMHHLFGSPMMIFTVGTPYTPDELRSLPHA